MKPLITKSKYINGVQCPAYLWIQTNNPSKIPELNDEAKHRMETGILVGKFATKLYPQGINVPKNYKENISETQVLLKKRKPLFEPGFQFETLEGQTYARIDILLPAGKDQWDIIEVKSGTKIKPINLHDVSFQRYVCEKVGLKIRKCFLCHINNEFLKDGKIKPKDFFTIENVDEQVEELYPEVEVKIKSLFEVIKLRKCPQVTKEDILVTEYANIAIDEFYDSLPEENVFQMYRIRKKKALELYEQGIKTIKEIPTDFKLNGKQQIQKNCTDCGEPHTDKKEIKEFLDKLKYPLYYLDFETFSTAIPIFDHTKPYQQIPFQYSLHIVKKKGAKPEHISYLADGTKDPRKEFLKSLKDNLGDKGSIVVYYQSFEVGRIEECVEACPKFSIWSEGILDRIMDLHHPFGSFHFYHPKQKGSASIKKVLPVFSEDVKYDDLVITNGADASLSYYKSHFEEVPIEEKVKIREALERYCELDTWAEIVLVEKLGEIVS